MIDVWRLFPELALGCMVPDLTADTLTHWSLEDFKEIFRKVIFQLILVTDGCDMSFEIVLLWMSLYLTDNKSASVQAMACCHQATSHYLSQCWPRFTPPYGVTRPQWVNLIYASIWRFKAKLSGSAWSKESFLYSGFVHFFCRICCEIIPAKYEILSHSKTIQNLRKCSLFCGAVKKQSSFIHVRQLSIMFVFITTSAF